MPDKIPLALIGCGDYMRYHVHCLRRDKPPFEVVALVDTAEESAKRLSERNFDSKPALFTDHRKMLAAVRPAAVIVSTPHALHYRHCFDALSAGAHVLVDKPMVIFPADGKKLVAHARRRKRIFQVAVQGLYTDTFAYARHLVESGALGKLQVVSGLMAGNWLQPNKGTWRLDPKLSGGGQLHDSTAHVLSAMLSLVGQRPREVFCWTDNQRQKVDVNAVATVRFTGGCLGTIASGGNCGYWICELVLQGEKGIIRLNPYGGQFRYYTRERYDDPVSSVPMDWKIKSTSPAANFAEAIQGKAKPRCDGQLGIAVAQLLRALYKSADSGRAEGVGGQ